MRMYFAKGFECQLHMEVFAHILCVKVKKLVALFRHNELLRIDRNFQCISTISIPKTHLTNDPNGKTSAESKSGREREKLITIAVVYIAFDVVWFWSSSAVHSCHLLIFKSRDIDCHVIAALSKAFFAIISIDTEGGNHKRWTESIKFKAFGSWI